MRLRYSRRATSDLASIHEFLSIRSPRAALSVMISIYAALEFIRQHPYASELTSIRGIRGKIVRKYRFKIFYRVIAEDDTIEIVHIRHTSRRPLENE
jgi:plasmid stabilization system protein ParE